MAKCSKPGCGGNIDARTATCVKCGKKHTKEETDVINAAESGYYGTDAGGGHSVSIDDGGRDSGDSGSADSGGSDGGSSGGDGGGGGD